MAKPSCGGSLKAETDIETSLYDYEIKCRNSAGFSQCRGARHPPKRTKFDRIIEEPINLVLTKALVEKQFAGKYEKRDCIDRLLSYQATDKKIPYFVVTECKGQELEGIRYEQLLKDALPYQNPENAFRVISGNFVTTEDGTGVVHTAPTFGADDARVAKEAHPEVPPMLVLDENEMAVPLVDLQGRFRTDLEEIGGKYVKNEYYNEGEAPEKSVDVEIAIKLKEENKAFKVEKYVHNYPHCWRTDKPVLYYPLDSGFILSTAMKDKMIQLSKPNNSEPSPIVENYKLVADHVDTMGLPLLRYQTPAGLPGGLDWLDAQSVMQRANFAAQLTRREDPYHIKANFDGLRDVNRLGLRTAESMVAFYLGFLVDGDVPGQVYNVCAEFMHRGDWQRLPFVYTADRADRKVRGLVHIIMALPQYSIN